MTSISGNATRLEQLLLGFDSYIESHQDIINESAFYFYIDSKIWIIDKNGVNESASLATPAASSCILRTDASTMLALSTGQLTPFAAYLSNKITVAGNKRLLKTLGELFKKYSSSLKIARSSTSKDKFLTVHVTDAYSLLDDRTSLRSIKFNKIIMSNKQNLSFDVVYYELEVTNMVTQECWKILRRFSEFENLRMQLAQNRFNVPRMKGSVSLFSEKEKLIAERMILLGQFIDEVIRLVGRENAALNAFLGNTIYGARNEIIEASNSSQREVSDYMHIALMEDMARVIDWKPNHLQSTAFLIRELLLLKSASLTMVNSTWPIIRFIKWLVFNIFFLLIVLVVSLKLKDAVGGMRLELNDFCWSKAHWPSCEVWLLSFDVTRLYSGIFFSSILLNVFSFSFIAFANKISLNATLLLVCSGVFSLYFVQHFSNNYLLYQPNWKYAAIQTFIITLKDMSESFISVILVCVGFGVCAIDSIWTATARLCCSGAHIGCGSSSSGLLCNSWGSWLRAVLACCRNILLRVLIQLNASMFWLNLLSFLVRHAGLLVVIAIFYFAFLAKNSRRYRRVLHIYCVGFGLVGFYTSIKLLLALLRLSESNKTSVYDAIDRILAPVVVSQIGQFRSVFIKFAQYLGGRSDVMSSRWSMELANLHDACPPSPASYIEDVLKNAFSFSTEANPRETRNKTEHFEFPDFIVYLDRTPIASASIGQVHCASINLEKLQVYLEANDHDTKSGSANIAKQIAEIQREYVQLHRAFCSTNSATGHHDNSGNSSNNITKDNSTIIDVVVKIKHENIEEIMISDMDIVLFFLTLASRINKDWKMLWDVIHSWKNTMKDELDFNVEASNLAEVHHNMKFHMVDAVVPFPVRLLTSKNVLVMSRLYGYKITDSVALTLHGVDKDALLRRVAHCLANQLLVTGVFNADPHAGNLMFCCVPRPLLSSTSDSGTSTDSIDRNMDGIASVALGQLENASSFRMNVRNISTTTVSMITPQQNNASKEPCYDIMPGLLDFGMTVRLSSKRRKAYCRLIIALFEADVTSAIQALRDVGYRNSQSDRAPERDVEFFEFLFRSAGIEITAHSYVFVWVDRISHNAAIFVIRYVPLPYQNRAVAQQESKDFNEKRKAQKESDVAAGTREAKGRTMQNIPEEFMYITRVIGLLRGLAVELQCDCPVLYILALNAREGLRSTG